jgi:16S rRNA (guanine527-N7)-methyltransferase
VRTTFSTSPGALPALREEAERLGLPFDDALEARFARYLALLVDWNDRAGLTAITDVEVIQRRHFGESLALLVALRGAGVLVPGVEALMVDLGPGGGFPGVPMAMAEPALRLVAVEAQERRCAFLRALADTVGLAGAEVVHARAEEAGRMPALRGRCDLAVARALAPLPVLIEYALPLLRPGGVLAAPKGSRAEEEVAEATGALAALGGTLLAPVTLSLGPGAPEQRVILVRRDGPLDDRYPRRAGVPSKRPL